MSVDIHPKTTHLVWLDLEMTGLNPSHDVIIEIATVITDTDLNIVAQGPHYAIAQSEACLSKMDEWNQKQHHRSGLIDEVRQSSVSIEEAQMQTLEFLMHYVPPRKSPLCGNSIGQDRRFLCAYMPYLERYFHYRNLDVSTVRELIKRWKPECVQPEKKISAHRALDDVYTSIDELKHYRKALFGLTNTDTD